jgi:hypothetical protein
LPGRRAHEVFAGEADDQRAPADRRGYDVRSGSTKRVADREHAVH